MQCASGTGIPVIHISLLDFLAAAVSNSAIKVKVIEGLDPAITDIVEALTSLDTSRCTFIKTS